MVEGEWQLLLDFLEEVFLVIQNFIILKKEIYIVLDMGKWKCFQVYVDYIGFIFIFNEGVKGKKLIFEYRVFEVIEKLVVFFNMLDRWIDEIFLVDQFFWFGNKVYRIWYVKFDEEVENLVVIVVFIYLVVVVFEVVVYLKELVGNFMCIDYGIGYEVVFVVFFCCFCKIGVFWVDD